MARRAWDHKACAGHFRHPAFAKRLCWQRGDSEEEARAFANEVAAVMPKPRAWTPPPQVSALPWTHTLVRREQVTA